MGSFLPNPSNVPVSVSGDWEPLVNVNAAGNNGYNAISLTNWDASTLAPELAQGSLIEIAGSIAFFATEEAIGGAADGTNYLRFNVTGSTVTPVWSLIAPTWNAAKNGWYSGAIRYSGHLMWKNGVPYYDKRRLPSEGGNNGPFITYYEINGTLSGSQTTTNIPLTHIYQPMQRLLHAFALIKTSASPNWFSFNYPGDGDFFVTDANFTMITQDTQFYNGGIKVMLALKTV